MDLILCPGCNVAEPWEHRCHENGCECEECHPACKILVEQEFIPKEEIRRG